MALATALAIGATVAGSVISSNKASSNANKAADSAAQNTAANNALTKEIYGENKGVLSPFVQTGTNAGALLNDFYGIEQPTQTVQPAAPAPAYGGFNWTDGRFGYGGFTPPTAPAPVVTQPKADSRSAFANYIGNSDYAFQQQEGGNAVNSGFAGKGTVQSGAAMKALENYRQNLQSGYRNQWASGVANQQGVGLTAAGALAGVSTNYAGTIAASNTAASDARANAALSQQSVFGNALGTLGGGILKGFG
jgi:hypothetical protein